jgi:hypothetical protein
MMPHARSQLTYKAHWSGKLIGVIDRFFPPAKRALLQHYQ